MIFVIKIVIFDERFFMQSVKQNNEQAFFDSINPATLEKIGEVKLFNHEDVCVAVENASLAQKEWEQLGFDKRKKYLLKLIDVIQENLDDIASLISKETGKPILEALGNDIMPVMDLIYYFAHKSEKLLRKEKIKLGKWGVLGRKSHLEFYPIGVIGVISPWNFPFSIPMGEVAMALMVGNTVVLKPSEYTSLVGVKIKELIEKAGFPKNVFQLVTGGGEVGAALVGSGVDKIAFTGSVNTGKKIMSAAAETLTPVTLELGGKDPFIVFKDANLDVASSAAVWGAFCNSGQVCASVERVYVEEEVKEKFEKLVVEKTKMIRQGLGDSFDTDMGSMTAKMQIDKVVAQVEDAKAKGAKILCGGEKNSDFKGYFFKPTVLTDVDESFAIIKEETFGPVLPIMIFQTEDEVIKKANDSEYALNAYVWTSDMKKAKRIASQIVAGTVNINESLFTHALPQTPWGGPKQSGIGRTHGAMGLLDLVEVRHVHLNKVVKKKNFFWWYGYSEEKVAMLKTLMAALFGKGFSRLKALFKFLKMSFRAKVR